MRDVEGALEVFVSITSEPRHLKFQETALWLSKLVDEPAVALRAIDALYPYTQESIARFDNSQQRQTYGSLEFASGRAALRHGDLDVAAARFKAVTRDSRFAGLASDCLRFVHDAAVAR